MSIIDDYDALCAASHAEDALCDAHADAMLDAIARGETCYQLPGYSHAGRWYCVCGNELHHEDHQHDSDVCFERIRAEQEVAGG